MAVCEVLTEEELRELFPLIDEGVSRISGRGNPVFRDRIGADVYHAVLQGKLRFFVIHDDDDVWGWGTGYLVGEEGIFEDLYIRPGAPKYLMREYADFFEKAMKAEGARRTAFTTTRTAWGRALNKSGYEMTCVVFSKEL